MIGCWPINSTRAEALFEVINECLRKRRIDITTLKCVYFDGAAVMSSPVWLMWNVIMSNYHALYSNIAGDTVCNWLAETQLKTALKWN